MFARSKILSASKHAKWYAYCSFNHLQHDIQNSKKLQVGLIIDVDGEAEEIVRRITIEMQTLLPYRSLQKSRGEKHSSIKHESSQHFPMVSQHSSSRPLVVDFRAEINSAKNIITHELELNVGNKLQCMASAKTQNIKKREASHLPILMQNPVPGANDWEEVGFQFQWPPTGSCNVTMESFRTLNASA